MSTRFTSREHTERIRIQTDKSSSGTAALEPGVITWCPAPHFYIVAFVKDVVKDEFSSWS